MKNIKDVINNFLGKNAKVVGNIIDEFENCCDNCENCHCCHEDEVHEEVHEEVVEDEVHEEVHEEVVEDEVHECCGNCENCHCCHEEEVHEEFDECNYQPVGTDFVVRATMEEIVGELNLLKDFLCAANHCDKCGGHKLVEMEDVYLRLLEVVGYTENMCLCDVHFDADGDVHYAAQFEMSDGALDWEREQEKNIVDALENNDIYTMIGDVEVTWACEEGVEPPTKNEEDLGFDVRAHFEEEFMMFKPHETKLVPTGLYAAVPTLWGLIAREKGSTGAIGLKCGAGVIDSGYRGEIFIALTNENDCHLVITKDPDIKKAQTVEWVDWENNTSFDAILYPYAKGICQLLVKFNPKVKTKVVTIEELKNIPSVRGEGKLGSTDNF